MSSQLTIINVVIRRIMDLVSLRNSKVKKDILDEIDELDRQFDLLIQANAPERITDERFTAAVNAINEVNKKIEKLRDLVYNERWYHASRQVLKVQSAIREAYRLLLLVRAGTPMPTIFQVSPQFLKETEIRPSEELVLTSPLASQIYGVLVRRGRASVEELAKELKISEEMRDEFNNAIAVLLQRGYIRPIITPDNRMLFQAVR